MPNQTEPCRSSVIALTSEAGSPGACSTLFSLMTSTPADVPTQTLPSAVSCTFTTELLTRPREVSNTSTVPSGQMWLTPPPSVAIHSEPSRAGARSRTLVLLSSPGAPRSSRMIRAPWTRNTPSPNAAIQMPPPGAGTIALMSRVGTPAGRGGHESPSRVSSTGVPRSGMTHTEPSGIGESRRIHWSVRQGELRLLKTVKVTPSYRTRPSWLPTQR